MALLRLFSFPTAITSLHKASQFTANLSLSSSSSFSTSSLAPFSDARLTQKSDFLTFKFSSSIAHSAASSSSDVITHEKAEAAREEVEEEASKNRLIAQNVPWTCTSQDIRALFEKHGTVLDVELSMHNKTKNRGLAFITMGSPEEALAALNNLEAYELEGRALKINYARKQKKERPAMPPKPMPRHALFVANLPFNATSKDLKEFFVSGCRNVVSAEVIYHDNPRRPSGYGFVSFASKKEADDALSSFQGKMFMERPIRIAHSRRYVKKATNSTQSEDTM